MAFTRYGNRSIIVNDNESYRETFFDKRDIQKLVQYDTARFYYPTTQERIDLAKTPVVWDSTARLYNLANEYYGDPVIGLILVSFLGALMLSPIHFSKFPLITFKYSMSNSILLVIMICCSLSIIIWKGLALLPVCLGYIFINIFLWFKKSRIKNIEVNI